MLTRIGSDGTIYRADTEEALDELVAKDSKREISPLTEEEIIEGAEEAKNAMRITPEARARARALIMGN